MLFKNTYWGNKEADPSSVWDANTEVSYVVQWLFLLSVGQLRLVLPECIGCKCVYSVPWLSVMKERWSSSGRDTDNQRDHILIKTDYSAQLLRFRCGVCHNQKNLMFSSKCIKLLQQTRINQFQALVSARSCLREYQYNPYIIDTLY